MVQKLVTGALKLPLAVVVFAIVVAAMGLYCYQQLDIEAYPNPVAPMIEIITQPDGLFRIIACLIPIKFVPILVCDLFRKMNHSISRAGKRI